MPIQQRLLFAVAFLVLLAAAPCRADSIMFIDEGGNIHFAERVSDVPERYRNQLRKSPTPIPDPAMLRKYEADRRAQENRILAERRKREAEDAKRRHLEEVEKEKAKKKRELELQKAAKAAAVPGAGMRPLPTAMPIR